jgi:hypothetical protein
MLGLRSHGPFWLTGSAHIVIVAIAAQTEAVEAWPWALFAMALVSFAAWMGNYRRYRQIHDLPTSRVASAAQGYVELVGTAMFIEDIPVASPVSGRPCCWYHYEIEEKTSDNKWKTIDKQTSNQHFLLVDDTGHCVISPDGAEVITRDYRTWTQDSYRYSESLLVPKMTVYAIGEFITHTANAPDAHDERADVSQLLADWKTDQTELLSRFDLDKDGKIDLKEWELARLQAKREVRRRYAAEAAQPTQGVHLLRKPQDGRFFLLASELPDRLGRRFRYWSWVHLAAFFACGIGGIAVLKNII